MNNSTGKFAVHVIAERVGIAISCRVVSDGKESHLELTPTDFHPNEGFAVHLKTGWRSAEAVLVLGQFSGQLIARMGGCDAQAKSAFAAFATGLASRKIKVLMKVNGSDINSMETETWPSNWTKLELVLRMTPIVIEAENEAQLERLVADLAVPIFGMIVSLIGAEENELPAGGELEGGSFQTLTTRYERSRLNREACIQLKGTKCLVCGFDFAEHYGPMGIGYIEIHHLTPVSAMGPEYKVNIATDLAPVCSNCHAMAHRDDPPVPLERLKMLVEERRAAKRGPA
jgi:5-methylcytosine-specific restriction protein A